MGRTALHYAVCMKGEDAEAMVKALTDAKSDETIKDLSGCDVAAVKASPIVMEEFLKNYRDALGRNNALVSNKNK